MIKQTQNLGFPPPHTPSLQSPSLPLSSASCYSLCQQAGDNTVISPLFHFFTSPTLPRTAHTIGVQASLTLLAYTPPPFLPPCCWHIHIPLQHLHDSTLHLQSSLITLSSMQKEAVPLLAPTNHFSIWLLKYRKWNQERGLEECA